MQDALPAILEATTQEEINLYKEILADRADLAYQSLDGIDCLNPIKAKGAMYMMVDVNL